MIARNEDSLKKRINGNTRIWAPNLEMILPIDPEELQEFMAWINWNGYRDQIPGWHVGYDFAAYLSCEEVPILGLPEGTTVRAVADGMIKQVWEYYKRTFGNNYYTTITIGHAKNGGGLISRYTHVTPSVHAGQWVEAGEKIGEVCRPHRKIRRNCPVHLHLGLYNADYMAVDPAQIFESISDYVAKPQRKKRFEVETSV